MTKLTSEQMAKLRELTARKPASASKPDRTKFYCGKAIPLEYRPLLCAKYNLPEACTDTAIFDAMLYECIGQ